MDGDDPPPPIQDPDPDDRSNASAEKEIDQRSISDLTKGKFGLRPTPPTEARSRSSLKAELEEAEEALKVARASGLCQTSLCLPIVPCC